MIYRRRFVTLLVTVATLSQLSPTIASYQECIDQTADLPNDKVETDVLGAINSQCPNLSPGSTCTFDGASLLIDGDPNFSGTCAVAGGQVYELDVTLGCHTDLDAGGLTKTIINNMKGCAAKVCTIDDVKALAEMSFASMFGGHCLVDSVSVSAASMMMRVSTTLFVALVVGIISLLDAI